MEKFAKMIDSQKKINRDQQSGWHPSDTIRDYDRHLTPAQLNQIAKDEYQGDVKKAQEAWESTGGFVITNPKAREGAVGWHFPSFQ